MKMKPTKGNFKKLEKTVKITGDIPKENKNSLSAKILSR